MIIACFIICILLVVVIILIIKNTQKTDKIFNLTTSNETYKKELDNLKVEIQPLRKYRVCVNAQQEADRILYDAQMQSDRLLADAKMKNDTATQKHDSIIESAKESSKQIVAESQSKADSTISTSIAQAESIIAEANEKAREIAGSAYEIAGKAKYYQELATAMKNIIDGYGDQYLKPTYSLLDELANDYGFSDVGVALKNARTVVKKMIKDNLAAKCDYVEQNRKETAVAFVLDAFNGKVDSILSSIKKDNYGTLERKVKDAYLVVNRLGSAFRNARITEQYLDARLSELKWGAAVVALKKKEMEEQRVIKERIREEEKARREYEKAMKDAAKQEDVIRKAMEKAQQEIAKASAEQKAKYELKLQELSEKLAEAEARSQRAQSMAQQTKSGHVYVISNIGSFGENVYKIGMTRRLEPLDRVRELGDASVPFPFDVHAMIFSEDAPTLETELHRLFARYQVNKVNPRKEFFRLPIDEVKNYITDKGLDVQWTILAEAAQYRETLALESSFENNDLALQNWERNQNYDIEEEENDEEI